MKSSNAILIAVFSLFLIDGAKSKKVIGLYSGVDNVIVLGNENFNGKVVGSSSAWIVEFYNSWCGHCKIFAPRWKEIATELKEWRPVISVAAVDCADEANTQLCRKYEVSAFPVFKFFPPFATDEEKGNFFHEQSKEGLIKGMVDFVSNNSAFEPPKSWPKLKNIISMHDIWDEVKDDHHHVAFVFEEPDSYIGRQVILDTFQYKRLLVRRMLKDSVTKFGITTFPSLYRINRDASFTRLAKENNTREGMVSSLKGLLTPAQLKERMPVDTGNQAEMAIHNAQAKQEPASKQEVRPGVYMRDLESTLHYSLRQEVAIHRDLTGDKLHALKNFLILLAKYFPGRSVVVSYLEKLSAWLKMEGADMTGDHWLNAVDDLQELDAYLPDRVQWVGCEGSEPHFRGYPCGMWTLFHVLTVSAYQKQRDNPRDLPMEVLPVIQGYMHHFFGCKTCVEHFLKMADTIQSSDLHPRSAILWLWRAHNKANNRLHGDKTEDPKHLKVQFPPKSLCPKCYSGEEFIEDEVLDFLLDFYGKDGIIVREEDEGSEEEIKYVPVENIDTKLLDWWERQQRIKDLEKIQDLRNKKMEKKQQKKESRKNALMVVQRHFESPDEENLKISVGIQGWGFSNLDMGMCVLFYLLCTLMILVMYYHFIVRRKYKPCPFS